MLNQKVNELEATSTFMNKLWETFFNGPKTVIHKRTKHAISPPNAYPPEVIKTITPGTKKREMEFLLFWKRIEIKRTVRNTPA